MNKMIRLRRFVLLLCTVAVLTACGQKGDLYLPDGKAIIGWLG